MRNKKNRAFKRTVLKQYQKLQKISQWQQIRLTQEYNKNANLENLLSEYREFIKKPTITISVEHNFCDPNTKELEYQLKVPEKNFLNLRCHNRVYVQPGCNTLSCAIEAVIRDFSRKFFENVRIEGLPAYLSTGIGASDET